MIVRFVPIIWDRIALGLRPPNEIRVGDPGAGHDGACSLTRYRGHAWQGGDLRIVVRGRPTSAPLLFILAHELAHAMHWRKGEETTEEEADRVAHVVCRELQLCWLTSRRGVEGGVQETWWVAAPAPGHAEIYYLPETV